MNEKISILIMFIHCLCTLNGQAIIVKPYLQDLSTSSVKVICETDVSDVVNVIYGTSVFDLNNNVNATSQIGNGTSRIHTAIISGLNPGTKYYYKARLSNGTLSMLYHFTTYQLQNKKQDINFIGISDMQQDASNPTVFSNLVNQGILVVGDTAITGGLNNLHGIIIPGDLVQDGGNYTSWRTTFFTPSENMSGNIPLYPALGNHEYYNNGLQNYLKYFDLPINGPNGLNEQVWYKDISNVRLISLNSNSGTSDMNLQLTWLDNILNEVCSNSEIDFVFAQLHHPYHSELWTPGELGFTGQVITRLETWASSCNKISAHYYGHTHAYSRGQSREHQHLMVNVATAGGAIDNWGEFPNADYPEYSVSQDEYGFVLIQTTAGIEPTLRIRRFGRGDQNGSANNILRDEIIVKANEYPPAKPQAIFPIGGSHPPSCIILRASAFNDPEELHQASQWQICPDCNFANNVTNIWKQHENWYNEVNTQVNDNLIDEMVLNLQENSSYCWRVRYRDGFLKWSPWSEPVTFNTSVSINTNNLLQNHDAENGTNQWNGQIESLLNNECNSVPVYQGSKFFAVGGLCSNESSLGTAFQMLDVSNLSSLIDNNQYQAEYSAHMRTYAVNNDKPEMYLEFLDGANLTLGISPSITTNQPTWALFSNAVDVPANTRRIKVWLKGTRFAGTDNDSYFDVLSVKLMNRCADCVGDGTDADGDKVCNSLDCDDNNNNIYPGALELCDSIDNNCDGIADSGTTVTFTGSIDNDWHKPSNWSQNLVPLPCQNVIIPTNKTVNLTAEANIQGLTVLGSLICSNLSHLTINCNNTNMGMTVNGSLDNQGKIIIKRSTDYGLQNSGTITNNGRIYLTNNQGNDIVLLPSGLITNQGLIDMK
jgi:acid phosphatase type 7